MYLQIRGRRKVNIMEQVIRLVIYFIVGYIVVLFIFKVVQENKTKSTFNNTNSGKKKSNNSDNWYDVLGVLPTASIKEIKEAYKKKMNEYHPDRVSGLGKELYDLAEEKSKKINQAYEESKKYNF